MKRIARIKPFEFIRVIQIKSPASFRWPGF
jgi:hypothetical protein